MFLESLLQATLPQPEAQRAETAALQQSATVAGSDH
jgi:hypothetical protein